MASQEFNAELLVQRGVLVNALTTAAADTPADSAAALVHADAIRIARDRIAALEQIKMVSG